jgi:hypothetical protein
MPCDKSTSAKWASAEKDSGFSSPEEARRAAEKKIRDYVKNLGEDLCNDDCGKHTSCKPTMDDAEVAGLIHIFSYPEADDEWSYGYRIDEGSEITVTCDCVKKKYY